VDPKEAMMKMSGAALRGSPDAEVIFFGEVPRTNGRFKGFKDATLAII